MNKSDELLSIRKKYESLLKKQKDIELEYLQHNILDKCEWQTKLSYKEYTMQKHNITLSYETEKGNKQYCYNGEVIKNFVKYFGSSYVINNELSKNGKNIRKFDIDY